MTKYKRPATHTVTRYLQTHPRVATGLAPAWSASMTNSGECAAEVLQNFRKAYEPISTATEAEAIRYAANVTNT
jgi:hypothetical protein